MYAARLLLCTSLRLLPSAALLDEQQVQSLCQLDVASLNTDEFAKYHHFVADWDASLAQLFKQLEGKTSSVTYDQMLRSADDATAASFNLEVGWHTRPP